MGNISKIRSNGYVTAVPGTYLEELDVSPDTERPLSPGKFLALVGAFDWLEGNVAHEYTTGAGMRQACSGSTLLKKFTNVCYAPSPVLTGAPEKVMLVTTQTTTAAQKMLLDAVGNDSILLTSRLWGPWGNRLLVSVAANADDGTLRDITLSSGGVSETLDSLGSGNLLRLYFVTAEGIATTVEVGYDPAVGLTFVSKYTPLAMAGTLSALQCSKFMVGGLVKGTPSADQTFEDIGTLTVIGTDSTGAALTGTAQWRFASDGHAQKTVQVAGVDVVWGSITSIAWTDSGTSTPTIDLEVHKVFGASEFGTFADVVEFVSNFAYGYHVSLDSELAAVVKLNEADYKVQTPLGVTLGAAIAIRADTFSFVDAINKGSQFVTAAFATTDVATRALPTVVASQFFSGGSATGGTSDDSFTAALAVLRTPKPHIIWVYTATASVHALLNTHIGYMRGPGRGQCCGWVGAASSESKTTLRARTKALNTTYLRMTAQDVEFETDRGPEYHDPMWLALYAAAIQATVSVAEPLNNYPISASNVRNTALDLNTDLDGIIEERISAIISSDIGLRFVRPLTTYRSTGDPALTESSADESTYMSIRDVQEFMESLGIFTNVDGGAGRVVSFTKTRLRLQVENGWIKEFDAKSVALRNEGADRYSDGWDFIPTIPVNFLGLRPRLRRSSFVLGGS